MEKLMTSFVLMMSLIAISFSGWAVEYDPIRISCYKKGVVTSYGAFCVVGYTMCIANPCPSSNEQ